MQGTTLDLKVYFVKCIDLCGVYS